MAMPRRAIAPAVSVVFALLAGLFAVTLPTADPAAAQITCSPIDGGAPLDPAVGDGFVPTTPQRLLDTRNGTGGAVGPVGGGCTVTIDLATSPVPTDASAVALNVTATQASARGFVAAHPCGTRLPHASNLNLRVGDPTPNLVVVPVDATRRVCLYTSGTTHLTADLTGWFAPGGGLVHPIDPARILDTRTAVRPDARSGPVPAGGVIALPVAGVGEVPLDATAVAVNVTVDGPADAGYVTAFPCGTSPPLASNVNHLAGDTRSTSALVGLGGGQLCLFTSASAHLVVDLVAWVDTRLAQAASAAAFTPVVGRRLLDTRDGTGGVARSVSAGEAVVWDPVASGAVTSDADAILVNVTATEAVAPGYVRLAPCGGGAETSTVNAVPGIDASNLALVPLGADGRVCVFVYATMHVVVDLVGVLGLSAPFPTSPPPAPPPPPTPTTPPTTARPPTTSSPTTTRPPPTTVPPPPPPPPGPSTFSFAVIPDTQNEVYAGEKRMQERVEWLLANRSSQDLRWVLHSGDVHNWPTPDEIQFSSMSSWLRPLDGVLPYMLTVGNHDTAAVCPGGSACPPGQGPTASVGLRDTTMWNEYYPPSRFGWEGVFEPGKSDNGWRTFRAGGRDWLILSFELWPRSEVIPWIEQVVSSHPRHNVILLSHEILNWDGSLSYGNGGYGANTPAAVWNEVDDYPNVQMMFSGHVGVAANTSLIAQDGHKVATFLQAFHDSTYNPTRIVTVDTSTGTIWTRIVANYDRVRNVNVDYEYTQFRATTTGMRFVT